jgi:hypothetical protein
VRTFDNETAIDQHVLNPDGSLPRFDKRRLVHDAVRVESHEVCCVADADDASPFETEPPGGRPAHLMYRSDEW